MGFITLAKRILLAREYLQVIEGVRIEAQSAIRITPEPEKTLLRCAVPMCNPTSNERVTARAIFDLTQAPGHHPSLHLESHENEFPLCVRQTHQRRKSRRIGARPIKPFRLIQKLGAMSWYNMKSRVSEG
jgi:hypothetical protein